MPYLGDFLGALAREVTVARLQADLEAVRIAEQYAKDPLLRRWSVPRFRLPTITVQVPVAVQALEETTGPAIDAGRVAAIFAATLDSHLAGAGLDLSTSARSRAQTAANAVVGGLVDASFTARGLAQDMADAAVTALAARRPRGSPTALEIQAQRAPLAGKLAAALASVPRPPARLAVLVTSEQVKEAGDSAVRVNLTLSEEGVEWTMLDPDDPGSARLVAE